MWIKTYIMTIVAVVLLSAIAEALMPETEMKKYISLVVGLVVLFAIAKPIISIPEISVSDMFIRLDDDVSQSSIKISKSIEEAQYKVVDTNFASSLSENISDSIHSACGIKCDVEVVIKNGIVENIKLNTNQNDTIKQFVKTTYGLECIFKKD